MDIFEAVIDEIALSGLEGDVITVVLLNCFVKTRYYTGCTPKELWYHLSNRKCPSTFPLALDEQAKCYIWSLLHEASAGIVNFYVLKSARQFHEDNLTFTYRLVSDSGIRGSCWEYDTREDVTSAILNDDTSGNLSQVITRWAYKMCVFSLQYPFHPHHRSHTSTICTEWLLHPLCSLIIMSTICHEASAMLVNS